MRKLLFHIHLYAGLFCAFHLITFGFSSLHFNHKFPFAAPNDKVTSTWERTVYLGEIEEDRQFAFKVRDELGLKGWAQPWEYHKEESTGLFHFNVERPGRVYRIELPRSGKGPVRVEEIPTGFWNSLANMHVLGGFPNADFSKWWPIYTEICTLVVLFAAISGVYFWAQRKKEKIIGWVMLAGGSGGSLAFMLYIWLIG